MNMNVRLKDLIGSDKAASLMLAFLPEECPYGGNHGGMCDWSCRDPYGEQGFVIAELNRNCAQEGAAA